MPTDIQDIPYDESLEAVQLPNYGYSYKLRATMGGLLTVNRTVYVDSVNGSDTNNGSQAAPFKTFARAVTDRLRYVVRDCLYTIQLVGDGPYLTGDIVGWQHQGSGKTAVRGDPSPIVHASGTATGDTVGTVLPTSPGLGVDTHRGRFLRMTSGACAGVVAVIAENADASVTVCNNQSRNVISGGTILNGDTFDIVSPRTTLSPAAGTLYSIQSSTVQYSPPLYFENLIMTGSQYITNVHYLFVRATSNVLPAAGTLWTQVSDAAFLGFAQKAAYAGVGISAQTISVDVSSRLHGTVHVTGNLSLFESATYVSYGCRVEGTTMVGPGAYMGLAQNGVRCTARFDKTVSVYGRVECSTSIFTQPVAKFAVTSGDCFRVLYGGSVMLRFAFSGGTTDPIGSAVNVSSGGRFFTSVAPTATGGTAGKDLRTTGNGGVANSVLSAAGTSAAVAADAGFGEVLARVA